MKILETNLIGKNLLQECEDDIAIENDFIAVIDGSTSKTDFRVYEVLRNGAFAKRLLRRLLSVTSNAGAADLVGVSVEKFCEQCSTCLQDNYQLLRSGVDFEHEIENRLCASMVIYSDLLQEIWMIGDCQAMVNGVLYENPKPYEARIAQRRADLILGGMSPADARKAIEPMLIEAMREGQNKTYAVLDGFPVYMPGVKVISVPTINPETGEPTEIVLASDGYPFLQRTLTESEQMLRKQLKEDPQNIKTFIATKGLVEGNLSFDDRAYVRFTI